ncbi:MAG: DUF1554 domain-containing protein [Leptospiraceae bacterium]|nr:DUF1554 domain-containing protein [Leptospiraceae bacterium]
MEINCKLYFTLKFFLGIFIAILFQCIPTLEKIPAHQLLLLETVACLSPSGCQARTESTTVATTGTGNLSPSGLSYSPASSSLVINIAITNLSPTVTGTVASYSISPTLPTGLAFNTTTGVISGTPTVLSASSNYTVTATNSFGSATVVVTIQVLNGKRIFVTGIGYKPGSVVGNAYNSATTADTKCNSDASRPAGPNPYKAMLVDSTRRASITPNAGDGQLDWVFKPNMSYERPDGTAIGNSNANSLLQFPLTNSIFTAAQYHTGLNSDWTTLNLGNCSDWTDGTSLLNGSGVSGRAEYTTTAILNGAAAVSCGASATGQQLLCVEQ